MSIMNLELSPAFSYLSILKVEFMSNQAQKSKPEKPAAPAAKPMSSPANQQREHQARD
jgi:hypothetical protein